MLGAADGAGMTAADWQEAPAEGDVKVHLAAAARCRVLVSTPGVQFKHQPPLIGTFFFFFFVCALVVWAQSKCCRTEWKRLRGTLKKHCLAKRKHLSGWTSVFRNVCPRSSSDLSAFLPHAVITGPTLKYCLRDGNSFSTWIIFSEAGMSWQIFVSQRKLFHFSAPKNSTLHACTHGYPIIAELHCYKS